MDNLLERIITVRKDKGMSLEAFAEAVLETKNVISNIENERTKVPSQLLIHVVDIFGVSTNWLLTGKGNMYGKKPVNEAPDAYSAPLPKPKLIKNQRQARIEAFINSWFESETGDEQAWLEMQIKRCIPEYDQFISNKAMEGRLQKKQVGS